MQNFREFLSANLIIRCSGRSPIKARNACRGTKAFKGQSRVSDYDLKTVWTIEKAQRIFRNIKLSSSFLQSAIVSARLDIKYL